MNRDLSRSPARTTPSRIHSHVATFNGMSNPHAVSLARAAEMISRKPATLRAWAAQTPPRGPRPTKTGATKQARTLHFSTGVHTLRPCCARLCKIPGGGYETRLE